MTPWAGELDLYLKGNPGDCQGSDPPVAWRASVLGLFTADLAISLDVIYHLTRDAVFETYITQLFVAGARYVIVYATNQEIRGTAPRVQHRHFT